MYNTLELPKNGTRYVEYKVLLIKPRGKWSIYHNIINRMVNGK